LRHGPRRVAQVDARLEQVRHPEGGGSMLWSDLDLTRRVFDRCHNITVATCIT
jgi:hypothetical protein